MIRLERLDPAVIGMRTLAKVAVEIVAFTLFLDAVNCEQRQ